MDLIRGCSVSLRSTKLICAILAVSAGALAQTVSGTGRLQFQNFDGASGNAAAPYVDGMVLPQSCGASGLSGQSGGWSTNTFDTTCFPNGTRQILASYSVGGFADPQVYSELILSASGNVLTANVFPWAQGRPVWFTTTGSLPGGLAAGSGWFWATSNGGSGTTNTITASIAGGVMTFTCSTSCGVTTGTPVWIGNIQATNQITGQPDCDGYYTAASGSGTSFTVTAPAGCPNGAASNINLEVVVNPYFVQYVSPTSFTVSATPAGATVTLSSSGSGVTKANGRVSSPYWTAIGANGQNHANGDYVGTGGPANVLTEVTFSNGNAPMEIEVPYWEMHMVAGAAAQSLCPHIKNTDLSLTTIACNASGLTYQEIDDGGVSGVCSVNSSGNVTPLMAGWCKVQVSCSGCAAGGATLPPVTVYIQVHSGSITFPHFTTCGVLATSFQTGSCHSFYPLGMWQLDPTFATSNYPPSSQMAWIGPMMRDSNLNSAMAGFGPGHRPGDRSSNELSKLDLRDLRDELRGIFR